MIILTDLLQCFQNPILGKLVKILNFCHTPVSFTLHYIHHFQKLYAKAISNFFNKSEIVQLGFGHIITEFRVHTSADKTQITEAIKPPAF